MIPKKIHYCWFGKGKKDRLFTKCLNSWKTHFPDWEIIEWNEDNFDINFSDYTRKAYEMGKYAFVSDVARLKIVYDEGGIYFDTDVEVIKDYKDIFLEKGYLAEERDGMINSGLGFAAPKNCEAIKIMLEAYDDIVRLKPTVLRLLDELELGQYKNLFLSEIQNMNFEFPCPLINTAALVEAGYEVAEGCEAAGAPIYGPEYFCGYDVKNRHSKVSNKTYSIHHFNASWKDDKTRRKNKMKEMLSCVIGAKCYSRLKKIVKR